jgi:hypothetical protein
MGGTFVLSSFGLTAMNNIDSKIAACEEEIRRLKLLKELLGYPELAAVAKEQLLKQAEPVRAAQPEQGRERSRPRRRSSRKRQLKKRALEIVKKSTAMLTAKQVTEQLEKEGFNFKAKDRAVAVSKALRALSEEKEIQALPGEKSKSAIRYSAPPSLLNLPVQENITH